jgi:chromosome segregation ATPase
MDIREVFDQLRTYYAKNVKPFEKLPEVIEAAIQVIEHELPAARKELDRLSQVLADLRGSIPDVETEVAQAKARVKTAQDDAGAAESSAKERTANAERLFQSRDIELTRSFEHKGATLQRDYETRKEEIETELMALEAKKAKLDQAIAAVKAQF